MPKENRYRCNKCGFRRVTNKIILLEKCPKCEEGYLWNTGPIGSTSMFHRKNEKEEKGGLS